MCACLYDETLFFFIFLFVIIFFTHLLCCQLTVQASDGGVPPRRQQVKVTVTISTDKNLPSFDKDIYTANMTEDQPIGASVVQVTAFDEDVSKTLVSH